jgi:negative regulator of sigma-B (phosphoserine phosphatase)
MTTISNRIKYTVLVEALASETVCGDNFLIKELPDYTLFAVADGLGHGPEAALASTTAMKVVEAYHSESLVHIIERCHQALYATRGSAITLARIDANNELSYLVIGNVLGTCWCMDANSMFKPILFRVDGGIVGYHLPPLRMEKIKMHFGDVLIVATDGINRDFSLMKPTFEATDTLADNIFSSYRNLRDDGLVLVAKLLGRDQS